MCLSGGALLGNWTIGFWARVDTAMRSPVRHLRSHRRSLVSWHDGRVGRARTYHESQVSPGYVFAKSSTGR